MRQFSDTMTYAGVEEGGAAVPSIVVHIGIEAIAQFRMDGLREVKMAYIVGLLNPEEEAELKRRGWEVEDAPPIDFDTGISWKTPQRMRMVWVDQDMFKIMDGPDWDKGKMIEEPVEKGS